MSTTPTPPAGSAPTVPARCPVKKASFWRYLILGQSKSDEIAVFHHSNLFYWWPVWLFGYIMAGLTYWGDMKLAVVPEGTVAQANTTVILDEEKGVSEKRNILLLPKDAALPETRTGDGGVALMQPKYYVAQDKGWGTLFLVILLLTIIITNITLRGLWSFLVLIVLIMASLLITAAGWWDEILGRLGQLAVYINLGGYLLLSTVLLVFWFVNFFIFDRQTYMVFTPGQVRLCLEIGGGETVYDTTGMVVQKQRGDLFRHWILGFGSGDLVIRPVAVANPIEMTNVLRVARVVRTIELMIKEKVFLSDKSKP